MLRCRLSYPKIMQIEGREAGLCDFFAQMQPILTKERRKPSRVNIFSQLQSHIRVKPFAVVAVIMLTVRFILIIFVFLKLFLKGGFSL